jgi:hypothetical protein
MANILTLRDLAPFIVPFTPVGTGSRALSEGVAALNTTAERKQDESQFARGLTQRQAEVGAQNQRTKDRLAADMELQRMREAEAGRGRSATFDQQARDALTKWGGEYADPATREQAMARMPELAQYGYEFVEVPEAPEPPPLPGENVFTTTTPTGAMSMSRAGYSAGSDERTGPRYQVRRAGTDYGTLDPSGLALKEDEQLRGQLEALGDPTVSSAIMGSPIARGKLGFEAAQSMYKSERDREARAENAAAMRGMAGARLKLAEAASERGGARLDVERDKMTERRVNKVFAEVANSASLRKVNESIRTYKGALSRLGLGTTDDPNVVAQRSAFLAQLKADRPGALSDWEQKGQQAGVNAMTAFEQAMNYWVGGGEMPANMTGFLREMIDEGIGRMEGEREDIAGTIGSAVMTDPLLQDYVGDPKKLARWRDNLENKVLGGQEPIAEEPETTAPSEDDGQWEDVEP